MSKYKFNKVKLFKIISPLLVMWGSPYLLWSTAEAPLVLLPLIATLLSLLIWAIFVSANEIWEKRNWWVLRDVNDE